MNFIEMKTISFSLAILCCILFSSLGMAQIPPNFDGTVGAYTKTLVGQGFGDENDITVELQSLIDSVTAQTEGGTIKLSGEVLLEEVYLKSNVHIDVAKGTVIKGMPSRTKPAMFNIGVDSRENIKNVKVFCSESDRTKPNDDKSEKFIFDIRDFGMGGRFRAFMLGNVSNFWISDFYVIDSLTQFSSITLNPVMLQTSTDNSIHKGLRDYEVIASPTKGDVRHIHCENQHGGYGVVQTQCAKKVNFERLSGIGGVTLRMESGAGIQFAGTFNGREHGLITGIRAKNLKLTNGFSCVTLSPHGRINGSVYLEDVKSVSSCFAVKMATGFFDSELVELDENNKKYLVDSVKFRKGRFDGPVIVKNVHAVYGTKASGRKQEYDYVEKSVQDVYPWDDMIGSAETTKTRKIPSSVALAYLSIPYAGAVPDTVEGQYLAQVEGSITSEGFVDCISKHYGNILYKDHRQNVSCAYFTSVIDIESENNPIEIYPNPADDTINVQLPFRSSIQIFNSQGQLKKVVDTLERKSIKIDISDLDSGIYFLKIKNEQGSKSRKFVVQ